MENKSGHGVWILPLPEKGVDIDKSRMVSRFTLPVRHLCWHPSLPQLGMATDDGKLVVWERDTSKRRDFLVHVRNGAVRCLSFDPLGEFVAAATSSGSFLVFSLKDGSEVFNSTAWPKTVIGSERLRIAWHPNGSVIALPGQSSVRLATRTAFLRASTTLQGGHRHSTTEAAWSNDGALLATASLDVVVLWRPPCMCTLVRLDSVPCSLLWSSAALFVGSVVGSWTKVLASSVPSETAQADSQEDPGTQTQATPATPPGNSQEQQEELGSQGVAQTPRIHQHTFQPGATHQQRRRFLAWNEHGVLKFFALDERGRQDASRDERGRKRSQPVQVGRVEVEYSRERSRKAIREIRVNEEISMGALGPGMCALAMNPSRSSRGSRRTLGRIVVHVSNPWEKAAFEHEMPGGESVLAMALSRHFLAFCTSNRFLRIHAVSGVPFGVLALSGTPICLAAFEDLLLCVQQVPGPPSHSPVLEYALYGVAAKERLACGKLPLSPLATLRWVGFSAEASPMTLDSAGVVRALALAGSGAPLLAAASGDWVPVLQLDQSGSLLWPVRAEQGMLYCTQLPKAGEEPRVGGAGAVQKLEAFRFHLSIDPADEVVERTLRHQVLSSNLGFALDARLLPSVAVRGMKDTAHQRTRLASQQVSKLFAATAKVGDVERAWDVVEHYFKFSGLDLEQLLGGAQEAAQSAERTELVERVAKLKEELRAARQQAEEEREKEGEEEEEEEENGEDQEEEDAEVDGDEPERGRSADVNWEMPPSARLKTS
uniref:WDHD1/CFT4 second beta-propeller domain-containing protein n=1 Tax=Noctiluca scintillans TaxID=2966 RepID=A0A7S0ZT98_NOCSC